MTTEINSHPISDVAMRLHDLGWTVVVYDEPKDRSWWKVVISGKDRPVIISLEPNLFAALSDGERQAKAWMAATKQVEVE
jgi:hypothetical protein